MASGNFLIGDDLSLEGFETYVHPILKEKGYLVTDKLDISIENLRESILTSISGEGDLEKMVNEVLLEAKIHIKKAEEERRKKGNEERIASENQVCGYAHEIGVPKGEYTMIGVYQDDTTASKLFPLIAQKYLLEDLKTISEEVVENIKSLLEKKLSEFLKS